MSRSYPLRALTHAGGTEMRSFNWNGRSLGYEVYGDGDPQRVVILLHGLLLDSQLNRGVARELAARGHRVVLLDLLGHGRSDKPWHASEYRMDVYAEQVAALVDHLGVGQAVVGGASLGANVSLHLADRHPDKVRALIIEMPVLERAVPVAALMFVPTLLAVHYALPVARGLRWVAQRARRTGKDLFDGLLAPLVLPPETTAAILHGILVGPAAPTIDARRRILAPTLVLGHRADLLHPFTDAEALARELPDARLVEATSLVELRVRPQRLLMEIDRFLDDVWTGGPLAASGD